MLLNPGCCRGLWISPEGVVAGFKLGWRSQGKLVILNRDWSSSVDGKTVGGGWTLNQSRSMSGELRIDA